MSFNKITIVGYLGRDPELRYTPQGTALCKMSIATTEKRKTVTGEMEEHTTWFRVTAWGRQAELANEYLAKGRQAYIEGRLRLEEYTDRDGQKRFSAEVSASEIQFLGQRTEVPNSATSEELTTGDRPAAAAPNNPTKPGAQATAAGLKKTTKGRQGAQGDLVSIEEDDIPF
jgi:single-strand DNA-binding protein